MFTFSHVAATAARGAAIVAVTTRHSSDTHQTSDSTTKNKDRNDHELKYEDIKRKTEAAISEFKAYLSTKLSELYEDNWNNILENPENLPTKSGTLVYEFFCTENQEFYYDTWSVLAPYADSVLKDSERYIHTRWKYISLKDSNYE